VLKVSHPGDDPMLVNLQSGAMGHAGEADPGLPLQRVLTSLEGEVEAVLETPAGERIVRVLEWLPGELLAETPLTEQLLRDFGALQGRLVTALEQFRHPADSRELAWDLAHLPELRDLLPLAPDLADAFDRFARVDLSALPRQVVHNDLNPRNVIVTEAGAFGILDFGDTVHTVRVADLGVSASYLVDPAVGWASIAPLVAGYQGTAALTEAELVALPEFVRARLVQRILLGEWLSREAGVPATGLERSRAQLASLDQPHAFGPPQ
jgi:Ser/Thr protein kinase RdoA (MazF antagonist)